MRTSTTRELQHAFVRGPWCVRAIFEAFKNKIISPLVFIKFLSI